MAKYSTNDLLDLCRAGIATKNTEADTAARELSSYIVFAYLLETFTMLPAELESRLTLLMDVKAHPEKYPEDILPEEEKVVIESQSVSETAVNEVVVSMEPVAPEPPDDGPLVA